MSGNCRPFLLDFDTVVLDSQVLFHFCLRQHILLSVLPTVLFYLFFDSLGNIVISDPVSFSTRFLYRLFQTFS